MVIAIHVLGITIHGNESADYVHYYSLLIYGIVYTTIMYRVISLTDQCGHFPLYRIIKLTYFTGFS